ncbi:MAG: hypothetical protein GX802_00070 [Clostridiales bacterium]|nr:hypothetical protein [Clostridiales bacterium]
MNRRIVLPLMISAVLGIVYTILILLFYGKTIFGAGTALSLIVGALAATFAAPHIVVVAIAAVFNTIAVISSSKTFALVAAILYCLGAILFIFFSIFILPSIVLCFIGYDRLNKAKKHELEEPKEK